MDPLDGNLKIFVEKYKMAMLQIRTMENKTAISALNYKYINNMRHFIAHFAVALEKAFENPSNLKESEAQFIHSIHDIEKLATDACQDIAAKKLKETEQSIRKTILGERKKAANIYKEAINHWDLGRNKRTGNPLEANEHFLETADLCKEAILLVKPLTLYQWIIMVIAILGATSGWVAFYFK